MIIVPWADLDASKSALRVGWILKYPAVKVHFEPAKSGRVSSRSNAESPTISVEVSNGLNNGVNWPRGYI